MDKLNLLKLFVRVIEAGSFAKVANNQGLSPSTISKAIQRLESDLKVSLLHRSTRQIALTQAGREYLETAKNIINQLEASERSILQHNNQAEGLLRINLPISYGRLYVLPYIGEFTQRYPSISLDISFDDRYVDMVERGIDIVLRSGTLGDSNLIAKQLSPIDFLICASPEYIKTYGQPKNHTSFEQHRWIRFRFRQTGKIMPIMERQRSHNPSNNLICDDGEALIALCEQGLGITQMPHFLAREAIQKGTIKAILPVFRPKDYGIWAIYANREFLPEKIRVFIDFIQEKLNSIGESPYHLWTEDL